jgi:3',5'-cyclic AMP phosphodiesterase CpdA
MRRQSWPTMRLRWWHVVGGLLVPVPVLKLLLSREDVDDGSESRLRALVVSDLHDSVASVKRLRSWFEHDSLLSSIDVVLCPGDITTQPPDQARVPAAHFEYMWRARHMLRALAALGKPIYFVPGNHEPLALFNGSSLHSSLTVDDAHNVHGRTVLLRPGLALAGWGGSSIATEGGVTVWPNYPFAEMEASALVKSASPLL